MDEKAPDRQEKKTPNKAAIIGGTAAGIAGTAALGYVIYRGVRGTAKTKGTNTEQTTTNLVEGNFVITRTSCDSEFIKTSDILGRGEFGIVYRACKKTQQENCKYAMKIQTFKGKEILGHSRIPEAFKREVDTYNKLRKLDITPRLYDAYICENRSDKSVEYFIILDKLGETLTEYITDNTRNPLRETLATYKNNNHDNSNFYYTLDRKVAIDVLQQIKAIYTILEKEKIWYTDWHMKNLMLNDGKIKLIDFGLLSSKRNAFTYIMIFLIIPILILANPVTLDVALGIISGQGIQFFNSYGQNFLKKKLIWIFKRFGDPNSFYDYYSIGVNKYIDTVMKYIKSRKDKEK